MSSGATIPLLRRTSRIEGQDDVWIEPTGISGSERAMMATRRWALALLAGASAAPAAWAHSLEEVQGILGGEERYFQALDKPAPDFTLRSADGRTFKLADFRGKVVVLHFIYTSCPDVCPLHAERIAEIQKMINETPMKDRVQFITITTDPTRDTPDVLRAFGPAHGLDPANWLFLTTTPDQPEDTTRKLAEAFGHKFTREEDGYQMHSIVTHAIDRNGIWKGNFHSLKFQPVNMVVFINALVNDVHPEDEEEGFWRWLKALF
jgi:protein SCO1/2